MNYELIQREIDDNNIIYDNFPIKHKTQEKYLGDQLHEGGLKASNLATVMERKPRTIGAIFEIQSVLEDLRLHALGGMSSGLLIWQLAVIPSLLNNAGTWTEIDMETLKELDKLEALFLSVLLAVPLSAPRASLFWDTGTVSMENKIIKEKLGLAFHIKSLEDTTLAKQIYLEQVKNNWPGLTQEVGELCENMSIPNIISSDQIMSKYSWKKLVKKAVETKNTEELKEKIEGYSKLEELKTETKCEMKPYLKELSMKDARMKYRLRTNSFDCKMNQSSDPKNTASLWKCDSCMVNIDTQSHVLWCPAYAKLREGKSMDCDQDVLDYFHKVMVIRQKLKLRK